MYIVSDGEADYQLNINIFGCTQALETDRLEENDTLETGELLTPNLYGSFNDHRR